MTDEQAKNLVEAVHSHGDQLGRNLVLLKGFLERLQQEQKEFLAEQRALSDAAQQKAHWTAIFSAVAAGAAAVAAIVQVYSSIETQTPQQSGTEAIAAPTPTPPPSAAPG